MQRECQKGCGSEFREEADVGVEREARGARGGGVPQRNKPSPVLRKIEEFIRQNNQEHEMTATTEFMGTVTR